MEIVYKFNMISNQPPYRVMYACMSDDKYYKTYNSSKNKIISEEITKEEYASQLLDFIIKNK
jgi:hypothetical protein